MDNAEIKKLTRQARHYGASYFSSTQQVEDFAQYVLIQVWCGRKNLPFHYFLTEYLRLYRANTRSIKGRMKAEGLKRQLGTSTEGTDIEFPREKMVLLENLPGKGTDHLAPLSDELKDSLTSQERVVIVLLYEWGFTSVEIGNVLGKSQPTISLCKTQALKKLRKFFTSKG